MTVRVITDSAATLPIEITEQLGIEVVPIRFSLGSEEYRDGEVEPPTLLARVEEVSTSGPTPMDFLEVISSSATAEGAVVATVSQDLSAGTYLAARAAADLADVPVHVVDTASAAGGEGLVVLEAARAAADGGAIDDVVEVASHVADRVRLVATLPDFNHLVRSGRVPEAAAWAGRWVGLRPVIGLRRGKVSPALPALSDTAARHRVLDTWRRSKPTRPAPLHVAVLHSLAVSAAEDLLETVVAEVEPATAFIGSFGTGMLVHTGPGVVGLAWWWDDRDQA